MLAWLFVRLGVTVQRFRERRVTRKLDPGRIGARAAAALAAALALAAPAAAQTEFRGGGFVSDFTSPCATDGWTTPNQIVARFRPAGQPGNSPTSNTLNLFFDSFTLHFAYPNGAQDIWLTTTSAATVGGAFGLQTDPQPQVRLLAPPSNTTPNPGEVHLVAEINHFAAVQNCQARVNLWLYQR